MGIPVVSSFDPSDNSTGIPTNKLITITFSEAIDTKTATSGTILVIDTETLEAIDGSFSFSSDETTVYFLPEKELRENTSYRIEVLGIDANLPAGYIKSKSTGDPLATTTKSTFQTTEDRFVSLEEITSRSDIDHIAPVRASSELAQVTSVLTLVSTDPAGFSSNNKDVNTISVTFDEDIDTNLWQDSWFQLTMTPVLDLDYYLGNTLDSDGKKYLYIEKDSIYIDTPTGTISVSGNTVTWTRTDYGTRQNTFPYNAEVKITLSKNIVSTSGATLGKDITFLFTTEFFPMFSGANTLRLDAGPLSADLYDDTLNRIILKRSIEAWELNLKEFSLRSPISKALQYTRWGSVLDLVEILSLKADMNRGISKQLGDLRIDYNQRAFAKDTGRLATAKKKLDECERALQSLTAGRRPVSAVLGAYSSTGQRVFQGIRNWDNLLTSSSTTIPAANFMDQREAMKAIDQGQDTVFFGLRPRDPEHFIYIFAEKKDS